MRFFVASCRRPLTLLALLALLLGLAPALRAAEPQPATAAPLAALPPTELPPAPGTPTLAPTEAQWLNGGLVQTQTWNCSILGQPYTEVLASYYTGYYGDLGVTPRLGEIFYIQVVWAVSGNPCGVGGAYMRPEVFLPEGVQLAISPEFKVRCFGTNYETGVTQEDPSVCPQAPGPGLNGGLMFDAVNLNPPMWPTPRGRGWTLWIPVVGTKPLNGLDGNPCTTCLRADVHSYDGNFDPVGRPRVPLFVADRAPEVIYGSPSTIQIASTTARSEAVVNTLYREGSIFYDLGTTPAYGYTTPAIPVPASAAAMNTFTNWSGLVPATTYHWRVRFVTSTGQSFVGANQSFTTLPAQQAPHTLALTLNNPAAGSVTTNPPGTSHAPGTAVTLTAQANANYRFVGWQIHGQLVAQNPHQIVMDRDRAITAQFATTGPYRFLAPMLVR